MRTLLLASATAALLGGGLLLTQQDLSKVEIKVIPVAGTVSMLEGAGGNIGVSVGDDGIVLVDDQFAPLAPKIEAALKKLSSKPIRFVLNTHHHGDHTGGNEHFGKSATIVAHENVRGRLLEGGSRASAAALPIVTFDRSLTIHLNGEEVRAIHFPRGHTDGDSVIFFTKSNVVHMGDDYFRGRFPFVDLNSGGSVQGLLANVRRVIEQIPADAKVIPGHGDLATVADLRTFADFLEDAIGLVRKAMDEGKSLEQMKADRVLGKYADLSWNFVSEERFTDTVHADLKADRKEGAR